MEALNLNTLASSLQSANPASLANAEKDLLNNFKAAALSITTLYRSARHTSKRAHNAGYAAACQDLLVMIQQGVSAGGIGSAGADGGMTIGRVMDWIEARLEAIKSREEEEDEDEEKERERERARTPRASAPKADAGASKTAPATRPKDAAPSQPPSPSPPPTALRPIHHPLQTNRAAKPRTLKDKDTDLADTAAPPLPLSFDAAIPLAAGAKRRHAVMMMLDSAAQAVPINGSAPQSPAGPLQPAGLGVAVSGSRRRTRNMRSGHTQNQNRDAGIAQAAEAMDVEEDGGRERKRVARR